MKLVSGFSFFIFISLLINFNSFPQNYKVIESGTDHILIEFNLNNAYSIIDTVVEGRNYQKIRGVDHSYRNPGDPWLPEFVVLAGIPFNSNPKISIINKTQSVKKNQFVIPFPEEDPSFVKQNFEKINKDIYAKNDLFPPSPGTLDESYVVRYANILPIKIAPYQFNPVTRELVFNSNLLIRIDFNAPGYESIISLNDGMNDEFLENSLINYQEAKSFVGRVVKGDSPFIQSSYWYNPNKNYFKIYLKEKGVFRVTYEQLIAAGVQLGSTTTIEKLELFNDGLPAPIEVFDNNSDQIFNNGDYFQFVGFPPSPSAYCYMNIYNLSNVYWFSYESDSSGLHFQAVDGYPNNYDRTFQSTSQTIHREVDKIYERLGLAPNSFRDYWFWEKVTAYNNQSTFGFEDYFSIFPDWNVDSNYVTVRVNMQGISANQFCNEDHKVYIEITDQPLGNKTWDGQNDVIFENRFQAGSGGINIYPEGNRLEVEAREQTCSYLDGDEIKVNWYEFEYWRYLKADENNLIFKNPQPFIGKNRYWILSWERDNMNIYVPATGEVIINPYITNDIYGTVFFTHLVAGQYEYFCSADDYFLVPDSIRKDVPADYRNISNGADYIIITHPDFASIANTLADFRENNFPDESIANPRIKIVDIQQIYDEFSFGLLDPYALQYFVKYTFENWQVPAPSYVVLLGDMSYDYRALLESSRPNFIPSIPYFTSIYGQAASDNQIVAVSGIDPAPDLAIGRLSIETMEEGNVLLQKLIDYPDDPTKPWKQNVLMLASGKDYLDEVQFGFNDASLSLGNTYVTPNGFSSSYVFRYPSKPEHEPFQGEGPKIREEINKGAALVNYYGHGGGYQWDLVFTNDDIYLLENGGRLPVIISVTCYTAHFDNQNVFGEQFNKVEGKGSIGFYGSSGLTYWNVGVVINRELYNEIFTKRNYIIGKAILNSKNRYFGGTYGVQINLLTYLGDPVMKLALPIYPDFEIKSNDITLNPENPLVGDSISVKVSVMNWGTVFPNDSVTVELFAESVDTSYQIGSVKRGSFPEKDSLYFSWVPYKGGLYTLTAKVNETDIIMEEDHSDNVGTAQIIIFNISEPNVLTPIDGFVSTSNTIDFNLADIGYYIPKELKYFVQIDTSQNFTPPLVTSEELIPNRSLVNWNSPGLPSGVYFWRARIFDGINFGNWSPIRSFSIMNQSKNGYYAHDKILKSFSTYNINYSEVNKSLTLNTEPLPAKPSNKTLLASFFPDPLLPDSLHLTALTTDGSYLYFGNIWATAAQNDGKSMIYRVGTGNNGTVEGQFYGSFSSFRDSIKNTIAYHSDGNIYIAVGMSHKIVRINVTTEALDTVEVPAGLLRWDNSSASDGYFYFTSDGQYIYNLTTIDSAGNYKYTLRTLDPSNNWALVRPDIVLSGSSYEVGFTGFFVHGDYIYPVEYYYSNLMRRIRLSDGLFEEEWIAVMPFKSYYSWCWDWQSDNIYASVYRPSGFVPKFSKFAGYYVDANGTVTTKQVGPIAWWNNVKYDLSNPSPTGVYSTLLLGQNSSTKNWDTLQVNIPDSLSLSEINPDQYTFLRLKFDLMDSTFQTTEPMELRSVHFDYQSLSDVYVERNDFNFQQDSLLQGYPVTFDFKARNFGDVTADSMKLNFYLNGLDSLIYNPVVVVPGDSLSTPVEYTINTQGLLFDNKITVFGEQRKREYYYFNNLIDQKFFVARDSVRPVFDVKFDGQEIIDNDIVSSTPEVVITLVDNSPLPLDTTLFTIVHNNKPLRFYQPELSYEYNEPGTPFVITWKPTLNDGRHTLEVLAKDASGNFFDSTSYRIIFYVYNENDISDVYNYPNPFARTTHFTFILKGNNKPDELDIKIYTIAGRLIRDIKLSPTQLITNFNKIYWDGRDEDGDEVGNGVYLYKVIAKFPDKTKTITQKLAKVR